MTAQCTYCAIWPSVREHGSKSRTKRRTEGTGKQTIAVTRLRDCNSLHCMIAQAQSTKAALTLEDGLSFPVVASQHAFYFR